MGASPLQAVEQTLLIIDDEPLMTDIFRHYMTKRGFRVLTACCGQDALAIVAQEAKTIALVITDMTMPGMDGIELARLLNERYDGLPVLITTGHDPGTARELMPPNVVDVVQKPYPNALMAQRIREILDSRAAAMPAA